jgi:hypothetical protein
MSPLGLETTISEDKRPQTYALDRAATGTGLGSVTTFINLELQDYNQCTSVQSLNHCSVTIHFNIITLFTYKFPN